MAWFSGRLCMAFFPSQFSSFFLIHAALTPPPRDGRRAGRFALTLKGRPSIPALPAGGPSKSSFTGQVSFTTGRENDQFRGPLRDCGRKVLRDESSAIGWRRHQLHTPLLRSIFTRKCERSRSRLSSPAGRLPQFRGSLDIREKVR